MLITTACLAQQQATDMAAIEKLHQQDIAATVASDLARLSALWDNTGLLLGQGLPPMDKTANDAWLRQHMAEFPQMKVLKYAPDIRDVQVAGDVAYEWGYFDAVQQNTPDAGPISFRGRFLRVLKRQADGTWKFARVMWQEAEK